MTTSMHQGLATQGLIRELVDYNLRRGSPVIRADVRQLLCRLTKDNVQATDELNTLIETKVKLAIKGHLSNSDFVSTHCVLVKIGGTSSHREMM